MTSRTGGSNVMPSDGILAKRITAYRDNAGTLWASEEECLLAIVRSKLGKQGGSEDDSSVKDIANEIVEFAKTGMVDREVEAFLSVHGGIFYKEEDAVEDSTVNLLEIFIRNRGIQGSCDVRALIQCLLSMEKASILWFDVGKLMEKTGIVPAWDIPVLEKDDSA